MARTQARPQAPVEQALHACARQGPRCRRGRWSAYPNCRTVVRLGGLQGMRLHIRRCRDPAGPRYPRPYRPQAEGRSALPQHAFGLDRIALLGALRYQQQRSVPEIHPALVQRGVRSGERSVPNWLERCARRSPLTAGPRCRPAA